jgi:hypothetical protein
MVYRCINIICNVNEIPMFIGDIMRVITQLILGRRDTNVPFMFCLAAHSCDEFIDNTCVLEMCNGQPRISHTFFCKS